MTDINDSPPVLEETFGSVRENSPVGTVVMQLSATDADVGNNAAPFSFGLLDSEASAFVTVDKSTGIMLTAVVIDREKVRVELTGLIFFMHCTYKMVRSNLF